MRAKAKADARRAREGRLSARLAKRSAKPRRKLLSEVQAAFNWYIRERDHNLPCISCGRPNDGRHQRHAGHYLPVGRRPELRFTEDNCHASCSQCNHYGGGGQHTGYRPELVRRIGEDRVLALESPGRPAKWDTEELERMKAHYRASARAHKKAREKA